MLRKITAQLLEWKGSVYPELSSFLFWIQRLILR